MIDLNNSAHTTILEAVWAGIEAEYQTTYFANNCVTDEQINDMLNRATEIFDGMLIEEPSAKFILGDVDGYDCTKAMMRYAGTKVRNLTCAGLLKFLDECRWMHNTQVRLVFRHGRAIAIQFPENGEYPDVHGTQDTFRFWIAGGNVVENNGLTRHVAYQVCSHLNERNLIQAIKSLRAITGGGLKDIKEIVEKMLSLIDPEWRERRAEKWFASRSAWSAVYHWDGVEFVNGIGSSLHRNMARANNGALTRASSVKVSVRVNYSDLDEQDQMPKEGK